MGTDSGSMGTDSGPMGTDSGPMRADAGPPDMAALTRQRTALDAVRMASCTCDMMPFGSVSECVAFNRVAEVDTCSDTTFSAQFSSVGGFFTCNAAAAETFSTCFAGAGCDSDMQGACRDSFDAARTACQDFLTTETANAYTMALDACTATSVVGSGGMCPDDSGAISTTGDSVFTGTTIAAGDDLAPPSDCVTVSGGGGSPDRAYRWTAPSAGDYVFDTIGSGFDTVLYVLSGCDAATSLGCNDDTSSTELRSSVTATLTADQEVLVVVEGFADTSAGTFQVNINAM